MIFAPRPTVGLVLLMTLIGFAPTTQAQTAAFWTDVAEPARPADARQIVPQAYRTVVLDRVAMASALAAAPEEAVPGDLTGGIVLALPMPDGSFADFRVIESSIMAPGLQARYPQLRTYLGQGITRPSETVRISNTPKGFRALVLSPHGTVAIDPYALGDDAHYIVYRKKDYEVSADRVLEAFGDEIVEPDERGDAGEGDSASRSVVNGETLRTYRLALAATGEYTRYHSDDTANPTVMEGLEAIVIAMARVNGIYEREVAVRMELIEETDQVIYTDPTTDPYTNNSGNTMLGENVSNLNSVIGTENYDIGHVFSTGGGGVAGLGVVCTSGKARGVTGLSSPINDVFYVDYVAHEMGHQYRGNHSFNGSAGGCAGGNRNSSTAYEPGSGSTIMAYAGICGGDNTQTRSDDYFHNISLTEIVSFTTGGSGSTCPEETETGNTPPTVEAESGFSIPVGTPFVLSGSGDDAETPEALTYNWEEFDLGPAGSPVTTVPPLFRSFEPTEEPVRYFPEFGRLLDNLPPARGENLPVDGRTLKFRLTARDNAAGGGGIADIQIVIFSDETAGPFAVTFPNADSLTFGTGTDLEVAWDVAGTDEGNVNTPTVDILYSDDDGETFTVVLEATPNDGSEPIALPDDGTDEGRIMIRAVDNIFFDVNDEPFNVVAGFVANETRPDAAAHDLSAVYPNPFGLGAAVSRATFNLSVDHSEVVRVVVYDALGREVAVLHSGVLAAGQNRQFALDAAGLAGGVYFVRAVGETFTDVRSFTVVR